MGDESVADKAKEVIPLYPEEMNFFKPAKMNVGVKGVYYRTKQTTFDVVNLPQRVSIHYPNFGRDYVDLKRSLVYVKFRIVDENRQNFEQKDPNFATPIDLILQTMWKNINISLSSFVVESCGTTYPYKGFFEYLLGMSEMEKRYQGSFMGSAPDDNFFDSTKPGEVGPEGVNPGLKRRNDWFRLSPDGSVEFLGKIFTDLSNQNRYILNETPITLDFEPAEDSFRLMVHGDKKPRILIEAMTVRFCHIIPQPKIQLAIDDVMQGRNGKKPKDAMYPMKKVAVLPIHVSPGVMQVVKHEPWQGKVPTKVIVGIVHGKAYSGDYKKNPFNFAHHNVKQIALNVGSTECEPIAINIPKGIYMQGLWSVYEAAERWFSDLDIGIGRENYKNGYTLFGFLIDPSAGNESTTRGAPRRATVTLTIDFMEAPSEGLTAVTYAQFDELLTLDHERVPRLTQTNPPPG